MNTQKAPAIPPRFLGRDLVQQQGLLQAGLTGYRIVQFF
jgi:hypothetical protein